MLLAAGPAGAEQRRSQHRYVASWRLALTQSVAAAAFGHSPVVGRSIGPSDNQPLLKVPSTSTYAADGDEDDDDDNSLCPRISRHHRDYDLQ